jgi:hypothetical protein
LPESATGNPLTRADIEARVNHFRAKFELADRMMAAEAVGLVLRRDRLSQTSSSW